MQEGYLALVGLSAEEEAVYRALIDLPGVSVAELGRASGRSVAVVRRAIASLEESGFVSRFADREGFVAEPPATVLGIMLQERERELERARVAAQELIEAFGHRDHPSEDAVSLVSGQQAVSQRYIQMLRDARSEILIFDTAPYVPPSAECQDIEIDGIAAGVRYRTVYDSSALEAPGQMGSLERLVLAGEQARTTHDVPMKLAIQDRRVGLVPSHRKEGQLEKVLLVRESALLDALVRLFEEVWRDASPLRFGTADQELDDDTFPSSPQRRMLALMGAGLKDETVARQLGLSVRTVERRMSDLMIRLNARTRFECALRAVSMGLIHLDEETASVRGGDSES